jgi:hypothetical protein
MGRAGYRENKAAALQPGKHCGPHALAHAHAHVRIRHGWSPIHARSWRSIRDVYNVVQRASLHASTSPAAIGGSALAAFHHHTAPPRKENLSSEHPIANAGVSLFVCPSVRPLAVSRQPQAAALSTPIHSFNHSFMHQPSDCKFTMKGTNLRGSISENRKPSNLVSPFRSGGRVHILRTCSDMTRSQCRAAQCMASLAA